MESGGDGEHTGLDGGVHEVIAGALAGSAVLLLMAGGFRALSLHGMSVGNRLIVAQEANALTALLVLGSAALTYRQAEAHASTSAVGTWARRVSVLAAAAITAGACYTMWEVLTLRASAGTAGIVAAFTGGWSGRLTAACTLLVAIVLAVVAIVVAAAPSALRPHRSERVPWRKRDWPGPWADTSSDR